MRWKQQTNRLERREEKKQTHKKYAGKKCIQKSREEKNETNESKIEWKYSRNKKKSLVSMFVPHNSNKKSDSFPDIFYYDILYVSLKSGWCVFGLRPSFCRFVYIFLTVIVYAIWTMKKETVRRICVSVLYT